MEGSLPPCHPSYRRFGSFLNQKETSVVATEAEAEAKAEAEAETGETSILACEVHATRRLLQTL